MQIDRNGFEVLETEECFALLGSQWLGRIGLTISSLPAILPVSYALDERTIVIRTVPGSKLQAMGRGEVVCFEVDHADRDAGAGWSVLVVGRATEITDPVEYATLDRLGINPWPVVGADRYVRLTAEVVSGRRMNGAPEADASSLTA